MNGQRPTKALALLLLWLGAFFGFASVAHGNLDTVDAAFSMHAARAAWTRGDSALLTQEQGGELLGERMGALHVHKTTDEGHRQFGKVGRDGRVYVWFPVGYVWLLVPFVAAGQVLENVWPAAETRYRSLAAPGLPDDQLANSVSYLYGHPVLTQGLIALGMPAAFAATSLLLLLAIGRALGASWRDAMIAAGAIMAGTQAFALGREQLSDGPGLTFVLAMLLVTVRAQAGSATRRLLLAGGAAAGIAVLLRYQSAFLVAACALAVAVVCRRRGRVRDVAWFALGGLPFLAVLLATGYARFGDPLDTGYPKYDDWFDRPMLSGLAKLFFAAGRGVAWLSPLLWLGVPLVARARPLVLRWLAIVLFAVPFLFFARARGWQGGQCWGVRYVTPGVVLLLAIVLPQTRPWERWPRTWLVLLGCGLFANLTSVVAPTRGQIQLASQAVQAAAANEIPPRVLSPDEVIDRISWEPRWSPLAANWSYVALSRVGGFETKDGAPATGAAATIEPMFGVVSADPLLVLGPQCREDRCGRHLWWNFWSEIADVPAWLLLLPVLAAAIAFGLAGVRRLLR
ncbi:MAG: glycosyltransferase family 39 protein [Planctomycetes bacterium]|nr:glycosyltransferase family 39 protein [Planctomycetota bacterium]